MAPRTTIVSEAIAESLAVRAVLIDPAGTDTITVSYVHLPARPAHHLLSQHGLQLAPGPIEELLGSRRVAIHRLPASEWLLTACDPQGQVWWLGASGPYAGRGLIVRWERIADQVNDTTLRLEEVGALLTIDDDEADDEDMEDDHAQVA